MKTKEMPLILFTVLSQAAVGITVADTAARTILAEKLPQTAGPLTAPMISLMLTAVAITASMAHLGHPLGGIRSLDNLKSSWLSREILCAGAYSLSLGVDLLFRLQGNDIHWPAAVAASAGMLFVCASAMTYIVPGYPAINNPSPVLFFFMTAAVLGPGVLLLKLPLHHAAALYPWFAGALVLNGTVHIAVLLFWMTGSSVMKSTALAHCRSPLFWARLVIGIALPAILPLLNANLLYPAAGLSLLGELTGRILFFNHMVHCSAHIGRA